MENLIIYGILLISTVTYGKFLKKLYLIYHWSFYFIFKNTFVIKICNIKIIENCNTYLHAF